MIARVKEFNALHAHRLQHLAQRSFKPAPPVAHGRVFVFGVAPQRVGGHERLQRLLMHHAIVDVGKHLVHARQFKNHLAAWLENTHPFCQQGVYFPFVEMFQHMDGGNRIG